jgi:hypothetical protein
MGDTQQPQPAGSGTTGVDAAAELARIQRRQEGVIKTALAPAWIWWVIAAALVAIGAARDSHKTVVLAVAIPLAALVIAAVVIATIPAVRHRVRINSAAQPGGPGGVALTGLILLVIVVIIALAVVLVAHRVPHPLTIAYAAGGAVLVIGGPLLNRYLGRLMLSKAGQPMADRPVSQTAWAGVMPSDPGPYSAKHAQSTNGGGTS